MQTIYRTNTTSSFTILSNELVSSPMPSGAKNVLIYLLSKPDDWMLRAKDISRKLALTVYAVRKALRQLMALGFVRLERMKTGHTRWFIFDSPRAQIPPANPAIPPHVEIPHVENRHVLPNTETVLKNTTTTEPPEPEQAPVVVSCENQEQKTPIPEPVAEQTVSLVFPEQLTPQQRKAAKSIIRKVIDPALRQPVLFALAYAMVNGRIRSVPGYLNGLVTAANNGSFTAVQGQHGTNNRNPGTSATQSRKPPEKPEIRVDNRTYFASLVARYGAAAEAAIGRASGRT